jgi:hypothetical protein
MCKECKETTENQEPELTVLETMMNRTSTLNVVEKIVEEVKQDSKPKFKTAWDQIVNKNVMVLLSSRNIAYYESKGYKIPRYIDKREKLKVKKGTKIEVKVKDLTHGSSAIIQVQCKRCGKIFYIAYGNLYNNCISKDKTYYCNECSTQTKEYKEKISSTKQEFKEKAIKVHGDKYWYALVIYEGCHEKILILCKKHIYWFWQISNDHLQGRGCPICKSEQVSKCNTKLFSKFKEEAKQIHKKGKYIYFEETYVNGSTKTKIFCVKCQKEFWQLPSHH